MKPVFIFLVCLSIIALGFVYPFTPYAQEQDQPAPVVNKNQTNGIRMNFRGADLDTVLDYLSRSAGFIIVKQTDVDGKIDVWSHQPLTNEEAINLLNTVLHEKGYAAIRNGRTLTIVDRDEAKQKNIPVKTGNQSETIPKNDEMVHQIIPVRYTDATQLIENLSPLLPDYANMTANESSNAILITDTQANVRRMAEIIRALDTSILSIATIRVFLLQYTDATELADIINELFETEDSDSRRGRPRMPFGRGRGGDEGQGQESEARKAASRVVAVADKTTNSLIVNAPEELMPLIENVVQQVDTSVSDLTEIRVFQLEFADATELAEQIQELFPDESSQDQMQFAPSFGRGRGGPPIPMLAQDSSERKLQQTTVRCTPDPRTNSIIVLAASETMLQIEQMVKQLDSDSSKKQKVYVYHLEYADVDNVVEILRNIFENQYSTNAPNRTTDQNANTLQERTVSTDTSFAPASGMGMN